MPVVLVKLVIPVVFLPVILELGLELLDLLGLAPQHLLLLACLFSHCPLVVFGLLEIFSQLFDPVLELGDDSFVVGLDL